MFFKKFLVFFLLIKVATSTSEGFIFHGFSSQLEHHPQNQTFQLGGIAELRTDGLFRLTNNAVFQVGHVFCSVPFIFKSSSNANAFSFSTTFSFTIVPENSRGHGIAFVLAPSNELPQVASGQHLGLFNFTTDGKPSNHIVAIEFDTFRNQEFGDIDDNHVGIDINSLTSAQSASAGYVYNRTGKFRPADLSCGEGIQVWVQYDGSNHQLNVSLSPIIRKTKPKVPLLSMDIDLSPIILEQMYVGFSSATGLQVASSYISGWSFRMDGVAEELDIAKLPSVRSTGKKKPRKKSIIILAVALPLSGVALLTVIFSTIFFLVRKKPKLTEILEDWEIQFGPHRFPYKDLYVATRGFNEKEFLGQGGFGQVFRGELPVPKIQIAVKRIFQKSKERMEEFIAEIGTIGRLRHPKLARLLGYCQGKDELLLVYDYMPNGSLDKFLYNKPEVNTLTWSQRFSIIKDVASAVAYLHEEWVEVIIHRDIKASNVLLDDNLNGKLGDFGLARCSKQAQETNHVAGTFGYMAPELARTGKASTSTDVYAFGVFLLEVACGRRPVMPRALAEEVHLVDWVFKHWNEGDILETADPKLNKEFEVGEIELVLKLGLFCTNNVASLRPNMSQVISYLNNQASLPANLDTILHTQEFLERDCALNCTKDSVATMAVTESFLFAGR